MRITTNFWTLYINSTMNCHLVLAAVVDAVRKAEHKKLLKNNDNSLTGKKYHFIKNKKDLTKEERADFRQLNLDQFAVGRAWNRKELLRNLWNYTYEKPARDFFKKWFFSATHSRLSPIIKVAKMYKNHFENIISYLKHRITNSFAEGINSVIQLIKSTARSFRNFENYRTAILFLWRVKFVSTRIPVEPKKLHRDNHEQKLCSRCWCRYLCGSFDFKRLNCQMKKILVEETLIFINGIFTFFDEKQRIQIFDTIKYSSI
jgi:hypothetical protein